MYHKRIPQEWKYTASAAASVTGLLFYRLTRSGNSIFYPIFSVMMLCIGCVFTLHWLVQSRNIPRRITHMVVLLCFSISIVTALDLAMQLLLRKE